MNIFNRIVTVLCLLGLIVVLVAGIFQLSPAIDALHNGLNLLMDLALANQMVFWAVLAVLLFVAILLLILEFRRPQQYMVKVQQASGGTVELSVESVADSLRYHISQVPGVKAGEPFVTSRGSSVRVMLDLELDSDLEVPAKSEEVLQLARELVETRLGLKLASIKVHIRQTAFQQQTPAAVLTQGPLDEPPQERRTDLPTAGTPALQS